MILYILMACITLHYGEQHLAYPVDYCALSAACAHDARPVCASRGACARRTFLDTCDMYEFNCDYGTRYQQTLMLYCIRPSMIAPTTEDPRQNEIAIEYKTSSPWNSNAETITICSTAPAPSCITPHKPTTMKPISTIKALKITNPTSKEGVTPIRMKPTQTTSLIRLTEYCDRPNKETATLKEEIDTFTYAKIVETDEEPKSDSIIIKTENSKSNSITMSSLSSFTTVFSPNNKYLLVTTRTESTKDARNVSVDSDKPSKTAESSSYNTLCCGRPNTWETTTTRASSFIILNDIDNVTERPTTKLTTRPSSITSIVTVPSKATTPSSSNSRTETNKTILLPPGNSNSTSCCGRPTTWETTTSPLKIITFPINTITPSNQPKTEFSTKNSTFTPKTITSPFPAVRVNITSSFTSSPTTNTRHSLPSTGTDKHKETQTVASIHRTTACCDGPKSWETTVPTLQTITVNAPTTKSVFTSQLSEEFKDKTRSSMKTILSKQTLVMRPTNILDYGGLSDNVKVTSSEQLDSIFPSKESAETTRHRTSNTDSRTHEAMQTFEMTAFSW